MRTRTIFVSAFLTAGSVGFWHQNPLIPIASKLSAKQQETALIQRLRMSRPCLIVSGTPTPLAYVACWSSEETKSVTVLPPSPTPTTTTTTVIQSPSDGVSSWQEAEWERVATCEVGSRTFGDAAWHMEGPEYSGIGFLNSTWVAYGGLQFAPNAGLATPDEQIIVGERIEGGYVPDQGYCASW